LEFVVHFLKVWLSASLGEHRFFYQRSFVIQVQVGSGWLFSESVRTFSDDTLTSILSAVPAGLTPARRPDPALKRWAIVGRPLRDFSECDTWT
jgi:hypothetical protein